MLRILAAAIAAFAVCGGVAAPRTAGAQRWNDDRTRDLVARATERRAQQLSDTGLVDYQAAAHGYLTFLAQVGEGFPEPPKIVKADELALEVYWRAPDLSKQRIVGRRDTLLLPTDISYHRDHLGIVQNNFPSIIRLGDGDEVRDVPHPLSREGLATYDYAISDSLTIALPDRTIDVFEVKVRPRDDRRPAAVGAVYIDRAEAQVVRMAFSFTRAALKDQQLEDVSIVLENALIEARFWLPRRQEIEIRRTGSWLDYPARGIIRGRWEICCYVVNRGINPRFFEGPEITQVPLAQQRRHAWTGRILDSLPPDVRAATDEDVRRVQEEARALVRATALARPRSPSLFARGISDFVRINRVEGLSLGAGVGRRFGAGVSASLSARYGVDDEQAKVHSSLSWQRGDGRGVRVDVYRRYREVGDEAETSLLRNSIAAQEFGSDYTQPYDARGASVGLDLGRYVGARWFLEAGFERQGALAVHAAPSRGRYEPTIRAWPVRTARGSLVLAWPTTLALFGTETRARAELRAGRGTVRGTDSLRPTSGRLSLVFQSERPFGRHRMVLRTNLAGVAGSDLPPQEFVYLGGPNSGPGYAFYEFVGRFGASQRVEWRLPIPFAALPLGRFGSTGRQATLAPFTNVVFVARRAGGAAIGAGEGDTGAGWYPALGLGVLGAFDLLRLDVARGLRSGRWTFSLDVSSDFWGIL